MGSSLIYTSEDNTHAVSETLYKVLCDLFTRTQPMKLIETGTYDGRGSTTLIHDALIASGVAHWNFITIECNKARYEMAKKYFEERAMRVVPMCGMSLPKDWLPSKQQIHEIFVEKKKHKITYDYDDADRVEEYWKEQQCESEEYGLLEAALDLMAGRPEFVFLDSAGHLGTLEFKFLCSKLNGKTTHLLLDDIRHCKHADTMKFIEDSDEWRVLQQSDERFGWALCRYL